MKKKLLNSMRVLLAAAALGTGQSAWAVTNNTSTVTGIVGATDNTSVIDEIGNKAMSLAAGEEYVITFVNYNKGASGTDYWENWVFASNVLYCRADHGASNPYWGSATNVSYTGNSWSDIYSTNKEWLQAYNGVTVTLTVSRDAAGTGISVAHTATTNAVDAIASQTYAGTFTATVGASDAINFYLTCEDAHLNITNVVYTNASGVVTHYDLKNVDLSTFDSYFSGSYSDGTATFTNSGSSKVWAKCDITDYFDNIDGTITNVNMKFTENVGSGGRITIGIYGNDKSSWATNAYEDTGNSVSVWGVTGSNHTTKIIYGSGKTSGVTYDAAAAIEVDMDIINKKFTWIQDGTTKVNNQAFVDTEITLPQYLALYSWSATNTTTLTDMTMEIVYVDATYYTATFTNTTSGNEVSATIYSDSERSLEVTNGTLEDGTTYYYTATETGYNDYQGNFTVSGDDPSVSFAMTAMPAYTINAVAGGVTISKIASGYAAEDAAYSTYVSKYVLYGGSYYVLDDDENANLSGYLASYTMGNSGDEVKQINYTLASNVVFFSEWENATQSISNSGYYTTYNSSTMSGGYAKAVQGNTNRDLHQAFTVSEAGKYLIEMPYYNNNTSANSRQYALYLDGTDSGNVLETAEVNKSTGGTFSKEVELTAGSHTVYLKENAANLTPQFDYLKVTRASVSKDITSAGWATYCSPYALDLENATGLTDAYIVTGGANGWLTMTSVKGGTVPANTGLLFEGSEGTVTIPVVASSDTDVDANKLEGVTVATALAAKGGYVLMYENDHVGFYLNNNAFTVGANTAYLAVGFDETGDARAFYLFGDESTGISAVENTQVTIDHCYNLNGQRVSQPAKGLYIVNGKKVIVK